MLKKSHKIHDFLEHHHKPPWHYFTIVYRSCDPENIQECQTSAVKKEKCHDYFDNSDTYLVFFFFMNGTSEQ